MWCGLGLIDWSAGNNTTQVWSVDQEGLVCKRLEIAGWLPPTGPPTHTASKSWSV